MLLPSVAQAYRKNFSAHCIKGVVGDFLKAGIL